MDNYSAFVPKVHFEQIPIKNLVPMPKCFSGFNFFRSFRNRLADSEFSTLFTGFAAFSFSSQNY